VRAHFEDRRLRTEREREKERERGFRRILMYRIGVLQRGRGASWNAIELRSGRRWEKDGGRGSSRGEKIRARAIRCSSANAAIGGPGTPYTSRVLMSDARVR